MRSFFQISSVLFLTAWLPWACQKSYTLGPASVSPPTATPTWTSTASFTPSRTFTVTSTRTFTGTSSPTQTFTPTATFTKTGTNTSTPTATNTITMTPIPVNVTTLVGSAGVTGAANGTGTAATFNMPYGVTVDSSGTLYVADTGNNMIRGVSAGGVVWTVAGTAGVTGSTNAVGTAASFNGPLGLVADSLGDLYIADTANNKIRKIINTGAVSDFAGSGTQGSTNGTGTAATFHFPYGVAYEPLTQNIYVADDGSVMVRKIVPVAVVTTLAGSGAIGNANGPGTSASFDFPDAVAVDSAGNVYVADFWSDTIRMITPGGVVSTLAGSGSPGSADGIGTAASFQGPSGVAVDSAGNVYVADAWNDKIRKIYPNGQVITLAGTGVQGSANGPGTAATFFDPTGIAVDSSGAVYVADRGNNLIRKIQ